MNKNPILERMFQTASVEWKALGEITEIQRGKRLTKNQLSETGNYPVYHGGLEPLGYYTSCNRSADTVMIINVGASAGTVGYCDTDFWSSDGCFCIKHTGLFTNKYLYYFLVEQEHFLRSKVRVAGIPTLDANVINKIQIPIPPLEVQREIVSLLDNFTELTAELTARKKQYEYYRNLLLDFNNDFGGGDS
ncbi:restriction endonuclease subunit S [Neisseria wadsworthii]|nr:restriction endonuclease subunit S [Neisseria wadsworthii]